MVHGSFFNREEYRNIYIDLLVYRELVSRFLETQKHPETKLLHKLLMAKSSESYYNLTLFLEAYHVFNMALSVLPDTS